MIRINMHISKAKLLFYPPCEVKFRLQNVCIRMCVTRCYNKHYPFYYVISLQEICTIVAGAKTATICRILWRFLGLSLYVGSIAASYNGGT